MEQNIKTVKLSDIAEVLTLPLHKLQAEDLVATHGFADAVRGRGVSGDSFTTLYDTSRPFCLDLAKGEPEAQSLLVKLNYDDETSKEIELPKTFRLGGSYGSYVLRREVIAVRIRANVNCSLTAIHDAINRTLSDETIYDGIRRKFAAVWQKERDPEAKGAFAKLEEEVVALLMNLKLQVRPVDARDENPRISQSAEILELLNRPMIDLGAVWRKFHELSEFQDLCGTCPDFNQQAIGIIFDDAFMLWLYDFYTSCRRGERTSYLMEPEGLGRVIGFVENFILLNLQGIANLGRPKEHDDELASKPEQQLDAERWSEFFDRETKTSVAFDQLQFIFKRATEGFATLDLVCERIDMFVLGRQLETDKEESLIRLIIAARMHVARPVMDALIAHYTDKVKWIHERAVLQLKATEDRERIAEARADEKERIMGVLAHNIHGFLSKAVVQPMMSLERQGIDVSESLEGVELLRSLIDEVKLTGSGNLADFRADTQSPEGECKTLKEILTDALSATVSNMLSRKFSGNSTGRYFPRKEPGLLEKAKEEFHALEHADLDRLVSYAEQHFSIRLQVHCAEPVLCGRVGNRFKTASRFLVLFQELLQNALKNLAFVPEKERTLSISIVAGQNLRFEFINTYSADKQEDTRLGSGLVDSMLAKFGVLEQQFNGQSGTYRALFELTDFTGCKGE